MHRALTRTAAAAGVAALVACGGIGTSAASANTASAAPTESRPPADSSTMRIATSGTIDNFNPFVSIYLTPTSILKYTYENLVQTNAKDFSITGGVAEKWEPSADGRQWTFTIRKNMKWSDGKPVTADDVVWTYQQMMDHPATMGAANGSLVENFKKVSAPDPGTVVIDLKAPQAPNPGVEIPIVPKHVWSAMKNPDKAANDKHVVGSGPFLLEDYKPNQFIKLKANPEYWGGKPKIENIEYIYYTNADASLQALRGGEVDFVSGLTPEQLKAVEGQDGIKTNAGESRRFSALGLNLGRETPSGKKYGTGHPALTDVKVRQAMRKGIDMDTLRQKIMGDYAQSATSFEPKAFGRWHLERTDSMDTYDVEGAKKLLDEAGWKPGADGIREKDGKKLQLRFLTDAGTPIEADIADFIKPWMKDIGIDIKVESSDADTISSREKKGDFDMYLTGWSVTPDPDYQLGINTCASRPEADGTGPTSQDGYCNPKFDELYRKQHTEMDENKRVDLVHQALKQHYDDVAQITLWYPKVLEAYRSDRFDGFTTQPDGGVISGQSGYWGFTSAAPVEQKKSEGSGLTVAGIVGGLAVVIVVTLITMRLRRRRADDRA